MFLIVFLTNFGIDMDENEIGTMVVDCAYKVHKTLGPGLLESTYEVCLEYELLNSGYKVERQKELPVYYNKIKMDAGYRIDLLIENSVIIELKSVETILPIHKAQILTYLKLSEKHLGLLINFNVTKLKEGINRFVL